jgi:hypothetical protein
MPHLDGQASGVKKRLRNVGSESAYVMQRPYKLCCFRPTTVVACSVSPVILKIEVTRPSCIIVCTCFSCRFKNVLFVLFKH